MLLINKGRGEAYIINLTHEQMNASFKDIFTNYDKGSNLTTAENLAVCMKKNNYEFIFESKHYGFYAIPPDQIPFVDSLPNRHKLIGIGRTL